jgi:group I intron endonuclease
VGKQLEVFISKHGETKGKELYDESIKNRKANTAKFWENNPDKKKEKENNTAKKRRESYKTKRIVRTLALIKKLGRKDLVPPFTEYNCIPKKIIGIYLIISPSGRIYIGQSKDIAKRWAGYHWPNNCHTLIYRSLRKYGPENHIFQIVHELPNDVTDEMLTLYETFYLQCYKDCGVKVGNIKEPGLHGKHSLETIERIRETSTGRLKTAEQRKRASEIRLGVPMDEERYKAYIEVRGRKVLQFSIEGNFIAEFKSIREATEITGAGAIKDCCRELQKISGGFIFKYKENNNNSTADLILENKESFIIWKQPLITKEILKEKGLNYKGRDIGPFIRLCPKCRVNKIEYRTYDIMLSAERNRYGCKNCGKRKKIK